ncbi:multicopper oxidase family protein [Acidobacteria bacterium AB60]|nr:multicopper oxidase family protein [Acidobacteria bacterium AB60]
MGAVASLAATAYAAAPGITSTSGTVATFNLTAQPAFLNQPDGSSVYSWGYGCATGSTPTFVPAGMKDTSCSTMQVPGPTLVVTEGQTVKITLTNNLPTAAGNTSILFPGFQVATTGGVTGLLTQEAAPAGSVTYSFVASTPGTHSYYSGTQGDLQVEMGLYGALIVLPAHVPAACTTGLHSANVQVEQAHGESDFRLSQAAYDHDKTCYDREYLFQFSEMDANIHTQALAQVTARANCVAGAAGCSLEVPTEPYHPSYFMINGRSMPDDMDANYEVEYPHQPYNGNPHMHPGEQVLLRIIGQGRWQHPFHEHANHVRILARDGNLILSATNPDDLAGAPLFTTTTTPGQTMDGIFYFTGRGLNWDMYAHHSGSDADPLAVTNCVPDANGYYTVNSNPPAAVSAINYYEWCQDHNKPLEVNPVGDVAGGGPATLPNPLIFTNGAWYSGSPYLGPDATTRAVGPNTNLLPSNTQANPATERGWAFMWHSHNEREITTNNVFPGGMMMMMLVDSREFVIDESN